ncbi:hypothetical protein E6P78_09270 [Streptomyces sp. A0958]|uniref:hypothetical protein n=1 Tax=Streptomyces sp. A0958 TaxID=2563101 RepID=UPI00109E422F|nr:hypothetical protein [Streptomyces sp. A0958]THA70742.1 hypothetical protein E6P78_09270 [Streptomyces sp. A0958]
MAKVLSRRKRIWIGGIALFAFGAVGCTQSGQDDAASVAATSAAPAPTVTVTVTATATETATPAPAPTVTETKTVKVPGPTVTATVTRATSSGSGGSGSGSGGSGGGGTTATSTCSIRSNAGNCYSAGQFCRNSDHGALTTTAAGARIKCSYSGSAWRWTYA